MGVRMRTLKLALLISVAVLLASQLPAAAQGKFKGDLVLTPLSSPDGRRMKVLQPFAFVDSKGRLWDVPAGLETDGASVPKVFWAMFPPWSGNYRKAAVIHDHFCNIKSRTWQETHNVFYEAMLAEGMGERIAKVLWAAVYNFGPNWGPGAKKRALPATEAEQKQFVSDLQKWVDTANPSREEIAKAIDLGRVPQWRRPGQEP
jgi:hypothetical protein